MIRLLVPGPPATLTAQLKGVNFRGGKPHFFTKDEVEKEAQRIRDNIRFWDGTDYIPMRGKFPFPYKTPIQVSIKYVFPFTIAQARQHLAELENPEFEVHHGVKPDVENSAKLLCDVLTELHFWADDALIDDLNLHKRRGSNPRIVIAFSPCSVPSENPPIL